MRNVDPASKEATPPAESQDLEDKRSLNEWREVVESVAALATARGGSVRIGVDPFGQRLGVQLGHRSLENLADQIKNNTEPPQFPSVTFEGDQRNAVVTVRVEESPLKPIWAFGRPYQRVGRTNQRLSREEAQRLQEATTGRTWDALPCPDFRPADLDRSRVDRFLRAAALDAATSSKGVLRNLGLVTGQSFCNGAALLFAKHTQQFVPSAQVKCARFRGLTSVEFLDERTLDGDVLTQVEEAISFVARNTAQAIRITGRAERETVPEYPNRAIREAITNAICHRDYTSTGTVQVRIYDDRLEVWNPGVLPADLTVEALYHEHPSRPRNRLLAQALHRARFIEQWGTGTLRIVQECETAGMPRPEFHSEMGTFMVRFTQQEVAQTRRPPADRNAAKALLLGYIRAGLPVGSRFEEFRGLLPGLSRYQIHRLLRELRQEKRIHIVGRTSAGVWYPGPEPGTGALDKGTEES